MMRRGLQEIVEFALVGENAIFDVGVFFSVELDQDCMESIFIEKSVVSRDLVARKLDTDPVVRGLIPVKFDDWKHLNGIITKSFAKMPEAVHTATCLETEKSRICGIRFGGLFHSDIGIDPRRIRLMSFPWLEFLGFLAVVIIGWSFGNGTAGFHD